MRLVTSWPSISQSPRFTAPWQLAYPIRGYAVLSAVKKGLHLSERARPQGYGGQAKDARPSTFSPSAPRTGGRVTYKERQAILAATPQPTYRILRGKKDITHRPDPFPKLTRAARFNSPNTDFGKKSMVYQLKKGQLREELHLLQAKKARLDRERGPGMGASAPRTRSFPDAETPRAAYPERSEGARRGSVDFGSERRGDRGGFRSSRQGSRDFQPGRREPREFGRREPREFRSERQESGDFQHGQREPREFRSERQEPRDFRSERSERSEDHQSSSLTGAELRIKNKQKREEISIPYTTAASQFLYGTSVVKAALHESRRKLYNLYIYAGDNRQNVERDAAIERLAQRRGVSTQHLTNDALMSKMAGGRPHNGYILEASPLPQSPVTGLGTFSGEEGQQGYNLNAGWQSAEEVEINGEASFVPTSSLTHKPLVVVLDQVLDPGNLGAILRSVAFLGATAVAITKKNSASLTPVALKASAGASEIMTLFSVDSLSRFLDESRENGWKVYAAAPATYRSRQERHLDLHQLQNDDPLRQDPCILLIGSEGEGLSKGLATRTDFEVNIPNLSGSVAVDSLNVSVAAGLLCSAFVHGEMVAQAKEMGGNKLF